MKSIDSVDEYLDRLVERDKMDEIKQLFKELLVIIQQYGDGSYNTQKQIIKRILNDRER